MAAAEGDKSRALRRGVSSHSQALAVTADKCAVLLHWQVRSYCFASKLTHARRAEVAPFSYCRKESYLVRADLGPSFAYLLDVSRATSIAGGMVWLSRLRTVAITVALR